MIPPAEPMNPLFAAFFVAPDVAVALAHMLLRLVTRGWTVLGNALPVQKDE